MVKITMEFPNADAAVSFLTGRVASEPEVQKPIGAIFPSAMSSIGGEPAASAPEVVPAKRTRRTKAQIEADQAAAASTPAPAAAAAVVVDAPAPIKVPTKEDAFTAQKEMWDVINDKSGSEKAVEQCLAILSRHGCIRTSQLKPEQYEKFIKDCNAAKDGADFTAVVE